MDGFCRAIARLKAESELRLWLKFLVNRLSRSSARAETRFWTMSEIRGKFGTFWVVEGKLDIGEPNGFQIRDQRKILHRYGEFESNRR